MNKKAEAGIGTLILFIAMILVAAIAAGVLIQTSNSLQSKTLSVGSRATNQVSTALAAMSVVGEVTNNEIDTIVLTLKLAPGSDSITLDDMAVTLSTHNDSDDYSYVSTITGSCDDHTPNAEEFVIEYLINSSNHRDGYLQSGEVIDVCFLPPAVLTEGLNLRLVVTPKTGSTLQMEFTTPDLLVKNREYLFP